MAHEAFIRDIPSSPNAVLMLHGICGTPDHFRDLLPLVPEDWTVHCLLLKGHGGTADDFAAASMAQWKAQVLTHLEALLADHERVFIAAHSMGTLFAIQAAVQYPDRIPALFLLGSPTRVFVRPFAAVNAVKLTFGFVDPGDRSAVDMQRGLSVGTTRRLWKYILWIPRFLELFGEIWYTRKLLPRLTVPARVFQSQEDELVHPSSCRDFADHPYVQCTLLPDSGHFGYGEQDLALLRSEFRSLLR